MFLTNGIKMNNSNKTFSPTQAILNNAARGKVLLEKSDSIAHQTIKEKVLPLVKNFGKSLSLEDVKQLYAFLNKAKDKYDPLKRTIDGNLTADSVAYIAAGGSSALAWTRMVLKQEGILKSYTKEISSKEINSEDEISGIKLAVSKAVNEDLMQATFVVMSPNEVDLHGDITTEDEIRKACHNFNKYCQTANLFHLTQTDSFEFAESYIAPTDFILGDKLVQKGTWLCTIQCLDQQLWELVKAGEINGVSIGALASVEKLEEE